MKNILIPTTLQSDTLKAIEIAIHQSKEKKCTIILALVNEIPNTESPSTFLRSMKSNLTFSQKNILKESWDLVANTQNCNLKIHNQYGISTPLINNLMSFFNIELTILTSSYKNAEKRIHQQFTQILSNNKCPILNLSTNLPETNLSVAMYLEKNKSHIQVDDLKNLIPTDFDLKIVSQAKIFEDQNPEDIASLLNETIKKKNINLLIETRKPKKIKLKNKSKTPFEHFGLPVLSIYEEIL